MDEDWFCAHCCSEYVLKERGLALNIIIFQWDVLKSFKQTGSFVQWWQDGFLRRWRGYYEGKTALEMQWHKNRKIDYVELFDDTGESGREISWDEKGIKMEKGIFDRSPERVSQDANACGISERKQ